MPGSVRRLVPLLVVAGLLASGAPGEAAALTRARLAAEAVRKKLPAPDPTTSFAYRGDILIDGLWAGEVSFTAQAAKVGRQTVWRVFESTYLDVGKGESHTRTTLHLDSRLAILSGSYERRIGKRRTSAAISRTATGFFAPREQVAADGERKDDLLVRKAAASSTYTVAALFLFLRAVPTARGGAYELPWFSPAVLDPMASKPEVGSTMYLSVGGEGEFKTPSGKAHESWVVHTRRGKESGELHWSSDRTRLLGMRVSDSVRVVPRGEGGARVSADLEPVASTWKAAFLKFGFGYHLAREELLEQAFHWDLMYEHEVEVAKRWSKERPLEAFKEAWILEFMTGSKHRTLQQAKRLLAMMLATGRVVTQTPDFVIFAAHPNFGGGARRDYYLRKKDGFWAIERITTRE